MGTGINRMKKLLRENGNQELGFSFNGFYTITFFRNKLMSGGINGGINVEEMGDRILHYIEENPGTKIGMICSEFEISKRTVERVIKKLTHLSFRIV